MNTYSTPFVSLASFIHTKALQERSLLNWDHDVYPTTEDDMVENIKSHVCTTCGWKQLSVTIENGVLRIAEPGSQLLTYDVKNGREIYGRLRHMGFTTAHLLEMKKVVG